MKFQGLSKKDILEVQQKIFWTHPEITLFHPRNPFPPSPFPFPLLNPLGLKDERRKTIPRSPSLCPDP